MKITVTLDSDDIILGLEAIEISEASFEGGDGEERMDQWEDVKIEVTNRYIALVKQALHKRVIG